MLIVIPLLSADFFWSYTAPQHTHTKVSLFGQIISLKKVFFFETNKNARIQIFTLVSQFVFFLNIPYKFLLQLFTLSKKQKLKSNLPEINLVQHFCLMALHTIPMMTWIVNLTHCLLNKVPTVGFCFELSTKSICLWWLFNPHLWLRCYICHFR